MSSTKKALLVTTVSGFVPQFEMNNVRILQSMGFEVHYAANYHTPSYGTDNHRLDHTGIVRHQVDFVRSPFKPENIRVYRQLKTLMEEHHFQLVHCHTPMGGVMARLAAHATKTEPVVYTAHGFHFLKALRLLTGCCTIPWSVSCRALLPSRFVLTGRTMNGRQRNSMPDMWIIFREWELT